METNLNSFFRKAAMLAAVVVPTLFVAACGDEEEGRLDVDNSAPAQVTNVSSTEGPGEVYLTWTIPASKSFMYSKVTYRNARGEEVYKLFSKDHAADNGVMHATIGGFITTDPVEFNIYACSVRGNNKGAYTYSAAPGAPAFLAVAQSITASPAPGGVSIGYNNETTADVYVEVNYTDASDASKGGTAKFKASAKTNSAEYVNLYTDEKEFINGGDAKLSITVQDADGNGTDPQTLTSGTQRIVPIDRSAWTFPGYNDTSNDATAGYSSQEAGGEGASPKGRVIAMIDGDDNTFWHTAWKTSSAYPHFFIVDMGAEYEVTNVSLRRRTNNNGTNIGHTFYTCTTANASGSNPTDWNWTNQGWYAFDRDSNRTQVYGMKTVEKARYIKVYYAETDKGGNFVMVSEFNAYTLAE